MLEKWIFSEKCQNWFLYPIKSLPPPCLCAAMFSCCRYFPSLPVPNFPVSWERRTGEAYELLVEDRIEERDLELADVMETEESD